MQRVSLFLLLLLVFVSAPLVAGPKMNPTVTAFINAQAALARKADPAFAGFDAGRGEKLYFGEHTHSEKQEARSCVSCHKKDAKVAGSHADTGKKIDAIAPVANKKRFTKEKEIRKWFGRNCKWVLERECTPLEKGDFLTWIYTLE